MASMVQHGRVHTHKEKSEVLAAPEAPCPVLPRLPQWTTPFCPSLSCGPTQPMWSCKKGKQPLHAGRPPPSASVGITGAQG